MRTIGRYCAERQDEAGDKLENEMEDSGMVLANTVEWAAKQKGGAYTYNNPGKDGREDTKTRPDYWAVPRRWMGTRRLVITRVMRTMGKETQKAMTRRRIDHDPVLIIIRVSLGYEKQEAKVRWDWTKIQRAMTYGDEGWERMTERIEKRLKEEETQKQMMKRGPDGERRESDSKSSMM